jgi:hypothetical protein
MSRVLNRLARRVRAISPLEVPALYQDRARAVLIDADGPALRKAERKVERFYAARSEETKAQLGRELKTILLAALDGPKARNA